MCAEDKTNDPLLITFWASINGLWGLKLRTSWTLNNARKKKDMHSVAAEAQELSGFPWVAKLLYGCKRML